NAATTERSLTLVVFSDPSAASSSLPNTVPIASLLAGTPAGGCSLLRANDQDQKSGFTLWWLLVAAAAASGGLQLPKNKRK
ncbi:MAG: hypothetical protein L6Q71_03480, partial [Planctomycetes bacterium]|nr:hypothetical protein [Planctomycetota bacterium]